MWTKESKNKKKLRCICIKSTTHANTNCNAILLWAFIMLMRISINTRHTAFARVWESVSHSAHNISNSNERKLYRSETRISGFAFTHLFTAFSSGSALYFSFIFIFFSSCSCIFILLVIFCSSLFRFTFQKKSQECGLFFSLFFFLFLFAVAVCSLRSALHFDFPLFYGSFLVSSIQCNRK